MVIDGIDVSLKNRLCVLDAVLLIGIGIDWQMLKKKYKRIAQSNNPCLMALLSYGEKVLIPECSEMMDYGRFGRGVL